jgi:hypothetical protein
VTHIVSPLKFKTKKSLKEAVKNGEEVYFSDPSVFDPCSGDAETIISHKEKAGKAPEFTVTNHPKRSWFARIYRNRKGSITVA